MRRRRKRSGGSWFPVIPTYYGESDTGVTWTDTTLTIAASPGGLTVGDTVVAAYPLTWDQTKEVDDSDYALNSLRDDVEGQDWICKRVVGETWFNHNGIDGGNSDGLALRSACCIALAVLPANEQGDPDISADQYNPLFAKNAAQPWLWRRVWHLGDPTIMYVPGTVGGTYSGLREGSFLDTKGVSRRITKDQRLFIIAAAGVLQHDTQPMTTDQVWNWGYDLRIFGAMRRSHNRSTFK